MAQLKPLTFSKMLWLLAQLILVVSCISSRSPVGGNMSQITYLPQPEIPENTRLLFEHFVVDTSDRTGNWRFRFDREGCFFNVRNQPLIIKDEQLLSSSDSELFWNTHFPEIPQRCLTNSQVSKFENAIQNADFESLEQHYSSNPDEFWSHENVERWTLIKDGEPIIVTVSNQSVPSQLSKLRAVIDQLVADAPRSTTSQAN